jgi:hypothetical protein
LAVLLTVFFSLAFGPSVAGAKCVLARPSSATTQAAPAHALLTMLAALRREQISTDTLPLGIAGGYTEQVFVRYERRLRVVKGVAYYLIPAIFTTCRPGAPYEAVRFVGVRPSGGASGTLGRINQLRSGAVAFTTGSGGRVSTYAALVPDGVVSVTLRYSGSPSLTEQGVAVNNCVVIPDIPRNAAANSTVVWHYANGTATTP